MELVSSFLKLKTFSLRGNVMAEWKMEQVNQPWLSSWYKTTLSMNMTQPLRYVGWRLLFSFFRNWIMLHRTPIGSKLLLMMRPVFSTFSIRLAKRSTRPWGIRYSTFHFFLNSSLNWQNMSFLLVHENWAGIFVRVRHYLPLFLWWNHLLQRTGKEKQLTRGP